MTLVRLASRQGRGVLLGTVVGTGMAFLDGTAINVALPALGRELGAGMAGLQWTLDAYLLTFTAFLLLGGSLGDLYGQRRIFLIGVAWFALASVVCGAVSTVTELALARALQGAGAALLVPGSLAVLRTCIAEEDQGAAIGAWTGLSGVSTAVGPLVGGWLVDAVSWRAVFFLNLPLAAVALWAGSRFFPRTPGRPGVRLDVAGALTAALGMGGTTFALIEGPARGWTPPALLALGLGVLALGAFAILERRPDAMLPLSLFASRAFTAANLTTLVVYSGLSTAVFLVVLTLQNALGYTPLAAGAALLPVTLLLILLSPVTGRLAQRLGARLPMTIGPALIALGFLLFLRVDAGMAYAGAVLPGVVVFALGLAVTVAPLTSAVMASVDASRAGIASGVNNAVARLAGLLGVAAVPWASGLAAPGATVEPAALISGFHRAMVISAVLALLGAAVAAWGIPGRRAVSSLASSP
jgi:EmrB/QacA subfamily drug resistance transporter